MARTRRRKKAGLFALFKLKTKTKKRLIRLSFALNLILLLAIAFHAFQRGGWPGPFKNSGRLWAASLTTLARTFSPESGGLLPPAVRPHRPVPAIPFIKMPRLPAKVISSNKPKLVVVVDDIGYTSNDQELLRSLGHDVTYAILPLLPQSRFFGLLSKETGAEVILHQPFESEKGTIPGPGLITDRMPPEQVLDVLARSIQSVPNLRGVNNHMGSRGTADPELMSLILEELKQRNLFFLDSMTSPRSVGWPMAHQMGVPALKRDVFLDNIDQPEAIRTQLQELMDLARGRGYAVGIGHYHHHTLTVLNEERPAVKKAGFELVSLQGLIDFLKKEKAL